MLVDVQYTLKDVVYNLYAALFIDDKSLFDRVAKKSKVIQKKAILNDPLPQLYRYY